MTDDIKIKDSRKAWDADTQGYGKHDYQAIDPAAVNPEDYAHNLRGEQQHFGDVREYNSALNKKHPETDMNLEDVARMGTIFETSAEGSEGQWMIVEMPRVSSPHSYARVSRVDENKEPTGETTEIRTDLLGLAVNRENLFEQVKTVIVHKGQVGREQRERLTKR